MSIVDADFRVVDLVKNYERYTHGLSQKVYMADLKLSSLLRSSGLEQYSDALKDKKQFWSGLDMISDLSLLQLGINSPSDRAQFVGHVNQFFEQFDIAQKNSCNPVPLQHDGMEFHHLKNVVTSSIVKIADNVGGDYDSFDITEIHRIYDAKRLRRFNAERVNMAEDNCGEINETTLFHGSAYTNSIAAKGYNVQLANKRGLFGAGIAFSDQASKANAYVFGGCGSGCPVHGDPSCGKCPRKLLINQVLLGKSHHRTRGIYLPNGYSTFNSVIGLASPNGLQYPTYVIYRPEQVLPTHIVTYRVVKNV